MTETKRSGHGFLARSCPGGAQDQTYLTCVQGHPVHCAGAAWREAGQWAGGQDPGLSGEGGPPIPLPVREAPAARTRSDASRPPAPAWPCTTVAGGQGEGTLPARKRSAGWPASSFTPRAGPGFGHTGRDQPGVLTVRPGLLLLGDRMLDIQAGSMEESPAQLGREGHVPRWGWRGGAERLDGAWPKGPWGWPGGQLSSLDRPRVHRLSAWPPHELSTNPTQSRNMCFQDCPCSQARRRLGGRPP